MAVYIEMFYANEKNEQTPILLDISTCTSVQVYLMSTDNISLRYWYSILYAVKLYKKKNESLKNLYKPILLCDFYYCS